MRKKAKQTRTAVSASRTQQQLPVYDIDPQLYPEMVQRATELAIRALDHYGEPTLSLEELRDALDGELGDLSLSEELLKDRSAGW